MNRRPQPKNFMEEVISTWHDDAPLERKNFHGRASEASQQLGITERAARLMIVAFMALPPRPPPRPQPSRLTATEESLTIDPLIDWLFPDSGTAVFGIIPDLFLCSRGTLLCLQDFCDRRRDRQATRSRQQREAALQSLRLRLGHKVTDLVLEYTKPLREGGKRRVLCRLARIANMTEHEQCEKITRAFSDAWQRPRNSSLLQGEQA